MADQGNMVEMFNRRMERSKALYWASKQVYHWVRTIIVIIVLAVILHTTGIASPYLVYPVSAVLSLLLVALVWVPNPATPAIGVLFTAMPIIEEVGLA